MKVIVKKKELIKKKIYRKIQKEQELRDGQHLLVDITSNFYSVRIQIDNEDLRNLRANSLDLS